MSSTIKITEIDKITAQAAQFWNSNEMKKCRDKRILWDKLPEAKRKEFVDYYKATVVDVNDTKIRWNNLQMEKPEAIRTMWDELSGERQNELIQQYQRSQH